MKITVNLKERSYPIYINESEDFCTVLKRKFPNRKFVIVTNTTIAKIYDEKIKKWSNELNLVTHIIKDGERYKTFETWYGILDKLLNSSLDRTAVVIAFGGGVIGDLTGFASSAFLRGVDYVQVPTTFLAMVDSSVGGKTGFNHSTGKNLIGAFYQPQMVWIDTSFFDTLPQREFIAGYGEVFKYAFIGGKDMFDFINNHHDDILNKDKKILVEAIKRSLEIKSDVVAEDERESGKRALLNFGHTFAHTLESFYNYENILHGEAVIWGIKCACDLGLRFGTISQDDILEYENILKKLPVIELESTPDIKTLYNGMFSDKKTKSGKLRFVLPTNIGSSKIVENIPQNMVLETLESVFRI